MKVKLIMVMTMDGVISRSKGETPMGWTSKEDKKLFREVTTNAGVLITGSTTYDTVGQPLPNRLNVVLTSQEREDIPGVVEHKSGDLKVILDELEGRGFEEVMITGGTSVNNQFLQAGLIDEIQLTIEPKIFGTGLRIFDTEAMDIELELLEMKKLNDNTINLLYKVIK